MTSSSQPEKTPSDQKGSPAKPTSGKSDFQAIRLDESESVSGPHADLTGRIKGRQKITAGMYQAINQRIRLEESSTESSVAHTDQKQVNLAEGQYQVPTLNKLKFLQELNHFLDDLSLRIHDLESRENFVSHSLLLLDHERRQFRLWKSLELQEFEHQKSEWKLSNFGIPKAETKPELSLDDQAVIQELRAASIDQCSQLEEISELLSQADISVKDKQADKNASNSSVLISHERVYILDIPDDDTTQLNQVTSAPQLKLPAEILEPLISQIEHAPLFAQTNEQSEHDSQIVIENIEIEFPPEDVVEIVSESVNQTIEPVSLVIQQVQIIDQSNVLPEIVEPVTHALSALPELNIPSQDEFLKQQQEWEALREQQIEDLERRQKLSLKQIRFQKEHLEKLRREYEIERNESFYELQQLQTRLANSAQILDLQQQQYRQARQLLDERTESLHREESLLRELMKFAKEQHNQAEVEVEYIYSLESRLKSTLETQENEFKRQEVLLHQFLQSILPKEKQLIQMQREIELSHRETLIIREALRHAWQQIKGDTQFPELERAFEFQKGILEQELGLNLQKLIKQLETVGHQNQESLLKVEEGMYTSLEVLETIRQELPLLIPPVSDLKTDDYEMLLSERQQWLEEKLEAERIIRQLVDQLERRMTVQSEALSSESRQSQAA